VGSSVAVPPSSVERQTIFDKATEVSALANGRSAGPIHPASSVLNCLLFHKALEFTRWCQTPRHGWRDLRPNKQATCTLVSHIDRHQVVRGVTFMNIIIIIVIKRQDYILLWRMLEKKMEYRYFHLSHSRVLRDLSTYTVGNSENLWNTSACPFADHTIENNMSGTYVKDRNFRIFWNCFLITCLTFSATPTKKVIEIKEIGFKINCSLGVKLQFLNRFILTNRYLMKIIWSQHNAISQHWWLKSKQVYSHIQQNRKWLAKLCLWLELAINI
jgi:hypothetical protein